MADKVVKIKVNFFIPENSIALSEEKNIYIRIARPDELILAESEFNLFEFEGKEIVYSSMRVVEYNNINDNNVGSICVPTTRTDNSYPARICQSVIDGQIRSEFGITGINSRC